MSNETTVNKNVGESAEAPAFSVAGLAVRGLELIQLRIPLRGEFSFRSFAVQVGAGAVVKSGVEIDPNLRFRIALVFRRCGRLGQAQANEQPVERR